jgi:ribonucleoside-triphosphate reductase (formate)
MKCDILKEEFKEESFESLVNFELEDYDASVEKDNILQRVVQRAYQLTIKKTYQAMEALIHNLNTMHSRAGAQVPFSSLNFGTDISVAGRIVSEQLLLAHESGLGNHETAIFPILIFKIKEGINFESDSPNYDLFRLALRVSSKRLFPNFSFLDAPFNKKFYQAGKIETEVTYMGCRTRVIGNQCGENQVKGRGNLSFTSINLVRLGILHGLVLNKEADWAEFYQALDKILHTVLDQLLVRLAYQANKKVKHFPFLMGQGIWQGSEKLEYEDSVETVLNQGTLSLGFIGLAECLKAMMGFHHGENTEAQVMGLNIVNHMNLFCEAQSKKLNLNITLLATPAEGLSGRFTHLDRIKFGVLEGITDREYYTNSFHVPVHYNCSMNHKLAVEGPYHAITPAGHISYVEMDGDPSRNLDAMEDIVRMMRKSNIGYGSINHPLDYDPICGFRGVIKGHICPKCQRDEREGVSFQRIRRITGYLVGTLDRFNKAKLSEVNQRVQHDSLS